MYVFFGIQELQWFRIAPSSFNKVFDISPYTSSLFTEVKPRMNVGTMILRMHSFSFTFLNGTISGSVILSFSLLQITVRSNKYADFRLFRMADL